MASGIGALPDGLTLAFLVLALGLAVAGIAWWSRSPLWGAGHRFAAIAAGLLTYAWHSFFTHQPVGGAGIVGPLSHVIFALVTVLLLYAAGRRIRARKTPVAAVAHEPVAAS